MTRKKATTRQPEPKPPWVEIIPQPWKQVKNHYRCCLCDRNLPITVKDQLEIVPVAYLINPMYRIEAQREEIGQLCQVCLEKALQEDAEDFRKGVDLRIYFLYERLKKVSLFSDHRITIPPEAVWIAAAAESIDGTGQALRDLAAATGLEREEIVRRLIAQAKPEDLGSNVNEY